MRKFARLCIAVTLGLVVSLSGSAFAQTYPTKPLRWIVAFAPGGGSDLYARTIAQQLVASMGQQVIVENRPGAAGIIAAEIAAKSPPDGYTLFACDVGTLVLNGLLYGKLPYDPAKDFQPVTQYVKNPLLFVVHPSVPASNIKEFVGYAQANPNKINYASVGAGTIFHLATEIFKRQTGTQLVHVPYKGAAPAVQDLVSGQVTMMFIDYSTGGPFIKAGKLRALGASTKERIDALPDLPSLHEVGVPNFDAYAWLGAAVPAATPKPIVRRLNQEIAKAMSLPDVRKRFIDTGVVPLATSTEEFEQLVKTDTEKWGALIKALDLKLEL